MLSVVRFFEKNAKKTYTFHQQNIRLPKSAVNVQYLAVLVILWSVSIDSSNGKPILVCIVWCVGSFHVCIKFRHLRVKKHGDIFR